MMALRNGYLREEELIQGGVVLPLTAIPLLPNVQKASISWG